MMFLRSTYDHLEGNCHYVDGPGEEDENLKAHHLLQPPLIAKHSNICSKTQLDGLEN